MCDSGKCKVSPSFGCTADDQCSTGHCIDKICRRALQAPNSACDLGSECIGGQCKNVETCADANGKDTLCDGSPSGLHCARLPLGSKCSNNGDCSKGFCRQGLCVASKDGDACVAETQCTGASVCSPTGKCHTPGTNTLYPQDTCVNDSQCRSKRCVANLAVTDQYDVELPYLGDLPEYKRCDYFKTGEGKCRNYVDCSVGICKNDKCSLGVDGDRCLYNQHCINVCGSNGICHSPPSNGSLGVGQPCKTDNQCFSEQCLDGTVSRPLPESPKTTHTVLDSVCYQSVPGGPCKLDGDCMNSACRSGKCVVLGLGAKCANSFQCYTGDCDVNPSSSSKDRVCILAPALRYCESDNQCYSNQCVLQPCPGYDYGGECGSNLGCATQPILGSCRSTADCDTTTASCDTDKKCRTTQGNTCTSSSQCLAKNCVKGKCATAAVSTTTKATTTTKSTATSSSTSKTTTSTSSTSTTKSASTSKSATSTKSASTSTAVH
ncbi:hypothetical protein CF327_g4768 [Tilletia walkeri]|uniref:Uncharacterized protein n=1 Tax=Tilletia walkeri TaxID=117179 RepID=A0A8X7N8V1_9BASI|nr:hypothetical protein CF327_g4768 [Tilletia walkeri]KAE8268493.1 hypothetical protein A4X09_0g3855 [Tilletia walkeri]